MRGFPLFLVSICPLQFKLFLEFAGEAVSSSMFFVILLTRCVIIQQYFVVLRKSLKISSNGCTLKFTLKL